MVFSRLLSLVVWARLFLLLLWFGCCSLMCGPWFVFRFEAVSALPLRGVVAFSPHQLEWWLNSLCMLIVCLDCRGSSLNVTSKPPPLRFQHRTTPKNVLCAMGQCTTHPQKLTRVAGTLRHRCQWATSPWSVPHGQTGVLLLGASHARRGASYNLCLLRLQPMSAPGTCNLAFVNGGISGNPTLG